MIVKTVYVCESCGREHEKETWVFNCYGCSHEICEDCMYGWGHCQECAVGKTRDELEAIFEKLNE